MKQYLLSIYQPDGEPPEPAVLGPVMERLDALNAELKAAGSWVFTGGLHAADTATVLRPGRDAGGGEGGGEGAVLVTDGPFAEGKEHLGGFWIITAPDLDAALEWGRRAALATMLPIEVRAFRDDSRGS